MRALAGLPTRRSVPEEGLPLLRRVLEPRRGVLHGVDDARARPWLAAHERPRAAHKGACVACLRWDAGAGAARCGHGLLPPEPVARDHAPTAFACRARTRRARAARGDTPPSRRG